MKTFWITCLGVLVSFGAMAQSSDLSGAVSFNAVKTAPAEATVEKKEPASKLVKSLDKKDITTPEQDAKALREKRLSKVREFKNPRLVKQLRGRYEGTQKSIEREQADALSKQTFETPADKVAAQKELEKKAIMRYEDFKEEPKVIQNKINQNPQKSTVEIVERVKFIDSENMTPEKAKELAAKADALFEKDTGMTVAEYEKKSAAELLQSQESEAVEVMTEEAAPAPQPTNPMEAAAADVLSSSVSFGVEKVDEKSAVIRRGAGS